MYYSNLCKETIGKVVTVGMTWTNLQSKDLKSSSQQKYTGKQKEAETPGKQEDEDIKEGKGEKRIELEANNLISTSN